MDPAKLQSHILTHLSLLPNTDPIHLTTLVSTPKRTNEIFPHSTKPPRCWQVDYFVVVGVRVPIAGPLKSGARGPTKEEISGQPSSSTSESASANEENPDTANDQKQTHLLTSAISAHLYILPHRHESILYISKVDSSSYGPSVPLPLTRTLVSAFISHFILPANRPTPVLRIQLFARSQGQYLFPNSAMSERKKGISGGRLCGWWKGAYEEAVRIALKPRGAEPVNSNRDQGQADSEIRGRELGEEMVMKPDDIRLTYLLPSYDALEAKSLLGAPKVPLPNGVAWMYEPPYRPSFSLAAANQTAMSSDGAGPSVNIADILPSLPDDPKTRFLDSLAVTSSREDEEQTEEQEQENDPATQRAEQNESRAATQAPTTLAPTSEVHPEEQASSQATAVEADSLDLKDQTASTWPKASPIDAQTTHADEASTTNNTNRHTTPKVKISHPARSSREDDILRKSNYASLSRISYADFWERLGFRQECAMDVTGFFSLVAGNHDTEQYHSRTRTAETTVHSAPADSADHISGTKEAVKSRHATDPQPIRYQLSPAIVERLHKALLNTDFGSTELAQAGSTTWMESAERIVTDEIGKAGVESCMGVVPAKANLPVSAAPKRAVDNVETVTMLQPRKKKRV